VANTRLIIPNSRSKWHEIGADKFEQAEGLPETNRRRGRRPPTLAGTQEGILIMKIGITVFLLVVGLALLGVGYSATSRLESQYNERYLQNSRNPMEPPTSELQHYEIKGEIQYCTGWLMIAAASTVFALGPNKKFIPSAG
jgi:hypothetical protein